jgi:UDP-N-acetyl-D-glucosamine dehydrogenase
MQTVESSVRGTLLQRIATHEARVGVVGLGYVGLPFLYEKAKVGFNVVGIDRNSTRTEAVARGESYISDVTSEALGSVVATGRVTTSTSFECVRNLDVIVICVPTPLTKMMAPDLQYVEAVSHEIARYMRPGQLISLESTTYPGTTDEVLRPIFDGSGLQLGVDYFLAHSPERVDPGNARYTTKNTNKVVGASDPASLNVAVEFYRQTILNVVPVSSAKAAELVKVYENTFRAVNIALANELAMLCDRMNLNVWEVLEAAFTKPFGIMPFFPGPGVGGHCIPIDPHYLEWKAREYNFETHFIGLAGETNRKMPEFVILKALRILNLAKKPMNGSKVLLLGVAYKAGIDDWRESPALEVLRLLEEHGADVSYHDPFVPEISVDGKHYSSGDLASGLSCADLVIITTAHPGIDYEDVVRRAPLVFDTRYATKDIPAENVTLL